MVLHQREQITVHVVHHNEQVMNARSKALRPPVIDKDTVNLHEARREGRTAHVQLYLVARRRAVRHNLDSEMLACASADRREHVAKASRPELSLSQVERVGNGVMAEHGTGGGGVAGNMHDGVCSNTVVLNARRVGGREDGSGGEGAHDRH